MKRRHLGHLICLVIVAQLFASRFASASAHTDLSQMFESSKRFYNNQSHQTEFIVFVDKTRIAVAQMSDTNPTWHDIHDSSTWFSDLDDSLRQGIVEYGYNRRGFVPDNIKKMIADLRTADEAQSLSNPGESESSISTVNSVPPFRVLQTTNNERSATSSRYRVEASDARAEVRMLGSGELVRTFHFEGEKIETVRFVGSSLVVRTNARNVIYGADNLIYRFSQYHRTSVCLAIFSPPLSNTILAQLRVSSLSSN